MPVACRNRNQTATNPLHLCKTVDKEKKRADIFLWFNAKYHRKVLEKPDSWYTGICLLIVDLFLTNIKIAIVAV